jgi:hypothetical protein
MIKAITPTADTVAITARSPTLVISIFRAPEKNFENLNVSFPVKIPGTKSCPVESKKHHNSHQKEQPGTNNHHISPLS